MNVPEKENNNHSGKIIEMVEATGTPFRIVKIEQGCFITVGNKRITEMMTEEEAKLKIEERDWGLITSLAAIISQTVREKHEEEVLEKYSIEQSEIFDEKQLNHTQKITS